MLGATSIHHHAPGRADATVTFTSNNSEGVKFPHYDALVISVSIVEVEVWKVLVDGGSSTDLLFIQAYDQLRIHGASFL